MATPQHLSADLDFDIAAADVRTTIASHMLADGLPFVLDMERSQGVRLVDEATGNSYIDMFGFFATSAVGMNHPGLNDLIFRQELMQAALVAPTNSDVYTRSMARFVEAFSRFAVPPQLPRLFFVDGGANAVGNAYKVATDWKVQKNIAAGRGDKGYKILHFDGAFHGRLACTMSTTRTGDPAKTERFAKFDWPHVKPPVCRFPLRGQNITDADFDERIALAAIRRVIEEHDHDIAAIVIEPIQGEGGDNHFRGEFLRGLRQIADELDVMLIFDEVQTGFGGTGKLWCCQHFDVWPDILVFGKKTRVCGIMVGDRVKENKSHVFNTSGRLNSTTGGSLVHMVFCRKVMEIMQAEGLVERCAKVGEEVLRPGLEKIARNHPKSFRNARGRGTFCAIDLSDAEKRTYFIQRAYEHGVIVVGSGASTVRFRPPLSLTEEEASAGLQGLKKAARETSIRFL